MSNLATPRRDRHGALTSYPSTTADLVKRVLAAANFVPGIRRMNKRGGYVARNFDVYGYDADRQIVALQLRQTWLREAGAWSKQIKLYLIGGIDEGQLFGHALDSSYKRIRDLDTTSPGDVVRWAEAKIFGVPVERLHTIIRQGDVALVPVRSIPGDAVKVDAKSFTLRKSHRVHVDGDIFHAADAMRWFVDGAVQIDHLRGQHRSIDAEGRFEVVCGDRRDIALSTPD